jgi:hypothetical protein
MANAQVALATITLGSAQSTVTFSSIPATYRDLRLVVQSPVLSLPVTTDMDFILNGDAGTNYSGVTMTGNGSSATSAVGSSLSRVDAPSDSTTADFVWMIDIMDYSATDKHKTILDRYSRAAYGARAGAYRWANTAAVTSITFRGGDSQTRLFIAGSTFSLFGILA